MPKYNLYFKTSLFLLSSFLVLIFSISGLFAETTTVSKNLEGLSFSNSGNGIKKITLI